MVLGTQPITSNVDYENLKIVNTTQSDHIFCCGSVTLSIAQSGTSLSLSIVGSGSNTNWFMAAVNWVAGNVGFSQNVENIRNYIQAVGKWSSYGANANPNAPPPPR